MKTLLLYHHLGLGDCISCNALVRKVLFENNFDKLYLIVKKQHLGTVAMMYHDEKRIECVPISTGGEHDEDGERHEYERVIRELSPSHILNIGHGNYSKLQQIFPHFDCHQRFYASLGYDFSVRYNEFKYDRNYQEEERLFNKLNPDNQPYIFVHGDSSRGRLMDYERIAKHNTENVKIIENDISESLLNFGLVLERAKQVHLMESSFRAYIETLNTDSVRLFLHLYVRPVENMFSYCGKGKNATSKDWTVLL
jgi:hypothetical protein